MDHILLGIISVCFLGLIITGSMMQGTFSFLTTDEGKKVSILKLQWPQPYHKLKELLDSLSRRSKDAARLNLRLDLLFMPCLYILMSCLAIYLSNLYGPGSTCERLLFIAATLPWANWLFDILEGSFTMALLNNPDRSAAVMMSISSIIKWLLAAAYIFCLLAFAISYLF